MLLLAAVGEVLLTFSARRTELGYRVLAEVTLVTAVATVRRRYQMRCHATQATSGEQNVTAQR